jgi:hypothetical protein
MEDGCVAIPETMAVASMAPVETFRVSDEERGRSGHEATVP